MAMSSESIVGIALVVILGAIIGAIFIGQTMGLIGEETQNRVIIDSDKEMMKLILYDSMIAYGCDVGGHISDVPPTSKFWGDWKTMRDKYAPSHPIDFDELNSSMPLKFRGLPCYGTGSTLPGTGDIETQLPYSPYSKELRDDQEGKYSKIKFEINDSDNSNPVTLPKCFVHYTEDNGVGGFGPQYITKSGDQVTNSWFLMSDKNQDSVFNKGSGWGNIDIGCETITNSGPVNPSSNKDDGPAMNVNVLDGGVGDDLSTGQSESVDTGDFSGVTSTSSIEAVKFEFPKGTKGYIQTNTGCSSQEAAPQHTVENTPGLSDKEVNSDVCDNRLHPYIVITKVGN